MIIEVALLGLVVLAVVAYVVFCAGSIAIDQAKDKMRSEKKGFKKNPD